MATASLQQLILLRHGVTVSPSSLYPDDDRPLSEQGASLIEGSAPTIRTLFPNVRRIVSSPRLRTMQTAQIVADCYGMTALPFPAILDGSRKALAALEALSEECVLAVGHEPDLVDLVQYVTGQSASSILFERGGLAVVEPPLAPRSPVKFYSPAELTQR